MIVKTSGSQMGSPAAAEEGGEEMEVGGGRAEREVKSTGLSGESHKRSGETFRFGHAVLIRR